MTAVHAHRGALFCLQGSSQRPMLVTRFVAHPAFLKVRRCAKSEVNSIDTPTKPRITVKESIANAKVYCKQNPAGTVSLRDYTGGIYNQTCTIFAADQRVTDPSYKIGSDWPAQDRPRKPGGRCPRGSCEKAVSTCSSLGAGCGAFPTGRKPPPKVARLITHRNAGEFKLIPR